MVIRSLNKLILQNGGGKAGLIIDTNNYTALRKILKFSDVSTADDIPFMNDLIFNKGAIMGGVFAGDMCISNYWGVSILLNSGGTTNGYGGNDAGRTYDTGWASFNVLMRSAASSTTFNRRLFTVRPNGQMMMYNDIWHTGLDNINRFYFANNSTTFLCSGGAANDNGLVVYSSAATGFANNLIIKNNGEATFINNITCTGITCTNSVLGLYVSGGGRSVFTGRIGVSNLFPLSMLHLGNCEVAGSSPVIVFGKNTGGGYRNAFIGYNDSFYFCIGDYGNTNTSNSFTNQFGILYNAPASSFVIQSSGYCLMQFGYGTSSDERLKTDIKTIEQALDKTLLLRGVEYKRFETEPDITKLGLIAQEVELIVPEVVRTSEEDGLKSIEYQNLVGLLIEAIKDQQKQINELKLILKNNNLN
jgi:hypothetical protein